MGLMTVPASWTVTYFRIVIAAVSGSTSTAITSAMKPYVLEELTRSSWSTALATLKPNTAVACSPGSMPSGSDSVFQWARPARSFTVWDGPLPFFSLTAPSLNSTSLAGTSIRCAAYSTSLARSLRAARAAALVPTEPNRLEYVPDDSDHTAVNVSISSTTVMSGGSRPSSSAMICDTIVWWPWPWGVVPRMAMTRPSGSTFTVADSVAPDFGRYSGLARNCGSSAVATYPMFDTDGSTASARPIPKNFPAPRAFFCSRRSSS